MEICRDLYWIPSPNTQSILAALPVVQHHPPHPQAKHLRWTQRQVLDPLLDRQFLHPQTQHLTRRGFQHLPSNISFDTHPPEFNPPTVNRTVQFNNRQSDESGPNSVQFVQAVPATPTQNLSSAYPETTSRMNHILDHQPRSIDYRSVTVSDITAKLKSMEVPQNDHQDDSWNDIQDRLDSLRERSPRAEIQPVTTQSTPQADNIADTVVPIERQVYNVPST